MQWMEPHCNHYSRARDKCDVFVCLQVMRTARRRRARTPPWNCSPSWLKRSAATSSSGSSWPARTKLWPQDAWGLICLFSEPRCHAGGVQVDDSPCRHEFNQHFFLPQTWSIRVKRAKAGLRAYSVINWTGAVQTDWHKLHGILLLVLSSYLFFFFFYIFNFTDLNFNLL